MKTRTILGVALLIGAGFGVRNLPPTVSLGLAELWPWATTTVTLYFPDGRVIVPVSRRMRRNVDLPRATLQALLDGPAAGSGLKSPIPRGVEIRSFELKEDVAHIDLSPALLEESSQTRAAEIAIVETMTALPGVTSVSLSVDGQSRVASAARVPLVYYASANGLVAVPVSAITPRAAVAMYLSEPPAPGLTRLPPDVRLLGYEHDTGDGVLSLDFSYTASVRTLALEQPDRMRLLLVGLIATFTEFPSVRAVRLDFEGQPRLGLGQCSDLLGTAQPRPALLNDERLLARSKQDGDDLLR
jgi:spore germination protein GerM